MRMNLLEETMDELDNDRITSPVVAVIDNDGHNAMDFEEFKRIAAKTVYDTLDLYVSVSPGLKILFEDGSWLERDVFTDDSGVDIDVWEHRVPPVRANDAKPFTSLLKER